MVDNASQLNRSSIQVSLDMENQSSVEGVGIIGRVLPIVVTSWNDHEVLGFGKQESLVLPFGCGVCILLRENEVGQSLR